MQKAQKIPRRIFREISLQQGDASEQYVQEVLSHCRDKRKLPPWLTGWKRSEKWSIPDRNGIDFIFWTRKKRILVSVKSSEFFLKKFEFYHGDQDIITIVVDILEPKEKFIPRLLKTLGDKYNSMR